MGRKPEFKIKTNNNLLNVNSITEITNIELLGNKIATIKTTDDLVVPSIIIDKLNKEFNKANSILKKEIQVETDKAKSIKNTLENFVQELKNKALDIVDVQTESKASKTTGELKTKTTHNLPTEIFSFTPAKHGAKIDLKTILNSPDKYRKFLIEVKTYELDMEKIGNANSDELPWIEESTPPKISFKKIDSSVATKLLEQLDNE